MHDELLAGVIEDPQDDARWAVLLDWLIAQGDPRGELAVTSEPDALLRSLAPEWFGIDVRVESNKVIAGEPGDSQVRFEFARGHITRIELEIENQESTPRNYRTWGADWIPALVRRVLGQPFGRLVQDLQIRQQPDWTGETYCDELRLALLSAPPLAVRRLSWGSEHDWEFVELPDCVSLLTALPNLESVTLQGDGGLESRLQHARVRELRGAAMRADALGLFAEHQLPALEQLTLWLEFDDTGEVSSEFEVEHLAPLLAAELPSLRGLTLPSCPRADEVPAALRSARWFAQLERISLD